MNGGVSSQSRGKCSSGSFGLWYANNRKHCRSQGNEVKENVCLLTYGVFGKPLKPSDFCYPSDANIKESISIFKRHTF